jgi:1-deoxy-D-xylulose-5-phosphate reductoisomerase
MNAANEVAVAQFLQGKIRFTDIPKMIEKAVTYLPYSKPTTIEEYLQIDQETRKYLLEN